MVVVSGKRKEYALDLIGCHLLIFFYFSLNQRNLSTACQNTIHHTSFIVQCEIELFLNTEGTHFSSVAECCKMKDASRGKPNKVHIFVMSKPNT